MSKKRPGVWSPAEVHDLSLKEESIDDSMDFLSSLVKVETKTEHDSGPKRRRTLKSETVIKEEFDVKVPVKERKAMKEETDIWSKPRNVTIKQETGKNLSSNPFERFLDELYSPEIPFLAHDDIEDEEKEDDEEGNEESDDQDDIANESNRQPHISKRDETTTTIARSESAVKKPKSRYIETRRRYKSELKRLPNPKSLVEYAKVTDYEACKNLVTFLVEEFENEDRQRIEAGRKLRKANAIVKTLKDDLKASKSQHRETPLQVHLLKRQVKELQDERESDRARSAASSTAQDQTVKKYADEVQKLRALAVEEGDLRRKTKEAAVHDKAMVEKLNKQLAIKTEARLKDAQKITELDRRLLKQKQVSDHAESEVKRLTGLNTVHDGQIKDLEAKLNSHIVTITTTKADHRKEVEGLTLQLQEQKQRIIDTLMGNLQGLQSQN